MNLYLKHWPDLAGYREFAKLSLDWYKHSEAHPYKGFTVSVRILTHSWDLTWVNDDAQYRKLFDEEDHGFSLLEPLRRLTK